jgi:hypothetical protein
VKQELEKNAAIHKESMSTFKELPMSKAMSTSVLLCSIPSTENEEVTGSSEEQVETDDSEEEVEVDDCEDYDLTDSTKQEVKDMGYEHNDTVNCRTYV